MPPFAPQISRPETDFFAQNACPPAAGVIDSLELLRKRAAPFSGAELATRFDLLLLPFLRGLPSVQQRVERLQQALHVAADRLPRDYEIVFRHLFLRPTSVKVEERREAALAELNDRKRHSDRTTTNAVKSLEERVVKLVAETLIAEDFELDLDEAHPIERPLQVGMAAIPARAFRPLDFRYTLEIDDDDHRRFRVFREISRELLLPDQRVAVIRYYVRMGHPYPVEGTVKVLSDGHTYIGTLADTQTAAVGDWMMHFIDLGERKSPGDTITITMTDELLDDQHGEREPSLAITTDDHGTGNISLALRLPKGKRTNVKPEARVVRNPHADSVTVSRKPLEVGRDGWIETEFSGYSENHQYGIFLPGLDIYT